MFGITLRKLVYGVSLHQCHIIQTQSPSGLMGCVLTIFSRDPATIFFAKYHRQSQLDRR